jgi:DNA repair exonuclease SbcCD ATPase subunit
MTDALITTILAVVVAVIGAFAAYYFGGRRERQKQVYEERRDEEKQREAEQDELRERRAEALTEMRTRSLSVVKELKSLVERLTRLRAKMPERTALMSTWKNYFNEYERLTQQRDAIAKEMASLRAYYEKQTPYLETTTRNLFTSFDREFERRYTPLSRNLFSDWARVQQQFLNEGPGSSAKIMTVLAQAATVGVFNVIMSASFRDVLEKEFSNMAEGIEAIQSWNVEAHEAAFDKEAKRVIGDPPQG